MAKGKPTQAEPADCRLYLVTPPALEPAAFAPLLTEALDAGDVACVQLRLKDCPEDDIRRACDILRPIAQERDVAFILNDHPRLARETGCDGVHVGQTDTPYRDARKILGNDAIVGVNIPNGIPLVYELDANLKPIKSYYLGDAEAAAKAAAAVANQGKA